ncbi:hypothetical protein FYK55_23005 [Roseiconus nitratireducens]|uniref:LUD domain-containing protein n=1 Tax=Roseiconus nitratireducens TaxID=2605748 RepID=A0A5M6CXT3_9BACT|nr:LUD domain-containing protein [Roseiconus nitratireducens]KAA5539913.1 hypothetical protein FYK55_23005 [Roseiconus nitratireducens]
MNQPLEADTTARRAILDRLNTRTISAPPLPDVDPSQVITYDDPVQEFLDKLSLVGGEATFVDAAPQAEEVLRQIPVFREAKRVVSVFPEAVPGTMSTDGIDDPHAFATIDWMIARGEFMVAENGAIWIDGNTLPHRVLLFIAQYLAIIVSQSQIVSNMHQAYDRIENYDGRYGVFVSGPSKTADIEQSLVLGAHGCRKLQVIIVRD